MDCENCGKKIAASDMEALRFAAHNAKKEVDSAFDYVFHYLMYTKEHLKGEQHGRDMAQNFLRGASKSIEQLLEKF